MSNIAFIFPAFVSDYLGIEDEFLLDYHKIFYKRLNESIQITGTDLKGFDFKTNNFSGQELKAQYISYIYSCTVSDFLKEQEIQAEMVAGYSMGIYAALYHCESISYEAGLNLIKEAYELISKATSSQTFAMGNIVGLTQEELFEIISKDPCQIEIVNKHSIHNHIISGLLNEVEKILISAKNEGAIYARLLAVSCPYHSKFIGQAYTLFNNYLDGIEVNHPSIPYLSAISQKLLTTKNEVKEEMAKNLDHHINWMETILTMNKKGIKNMVECGAGESLYKISKFICGDFKTYPVNKIEKFIKSLSTEKELNNINIQNS
jgi:[acyl-carrier-protein] S-malonyltransferase